MAASDRGFLLECAAGVGEALGAATQVVIEMAHQRGWDYGSHRAMKNAAERLSVEFADPFIGTGFGFAEKFHRNFPHNFMEDFELEADRDFVARMLAYRNRDP